MMPGKSQCVRKIIFVVKEGGGRGGVVKIGNSQIYLLLKTKKD